MPQSQSPHNATLADWLRSEENPHDWVFWGARASVSRNALANGSALGGRRAEFAGRSVLIATVDQLAAAIGLIELDGVARRLVLCPPGIAPEHLPAIVADAEVDALVSDHFTPEHEGLGIDLRIVLGADIRPDDNNSAGPLKTEWVLLTSGTTGAPKLVMHSLAGLTAAIRPSDKAGDPIVWATFYDIRRYGGLQIFLRAVLGSASLVLTDKSEPMAQFLERLRAHGATHITGTPSHWRRVLWSPVANTITPRYVRMSGEIADQAILDNLHATYPEAGIGHAYASTEAGVGFEVDDCREGFPASYLNAPRNGVEMKIEGGSLRLRSPGVAVRYLGNGRGAVTDEHGFVDTGDVIAIRDGRCYFAGRTGGVINVGGLKVHPEEVETVINRHPDVRMSLDRVAAAAARHPAERRRTVARLMACEPSRKISAANAVRAAVMSKRSGAVLFAGIGALALVFVALPSSARAQSADLVLCDRVAADPTDPDKPKDIKGVSEVAPSDVAIALKYCKVASASSRRAMYQLGRAYAANKQLSEAVSAYRKAADKGSTSAMVELGVAYANGSGVTKDEAQARKLLERAADAGNPRGVSNLAVLSNRGVGPSDPVKARDLLAKAAETNSAEAQYQLGLMVAEGIGGPKDDEAARALFEKAAAQNHPGALERMGAFAQGGRGGPQDVNAAKTYYEQAAALGNEDAKAALKGGAGCRFRIGDKNGKYIGCF